jgi:crotonobetainyl-CoA:carnitine CoA-transferase CaiB-like acyl-CoA transferase
MKRVLDDIRVLDFGRFIAAPYCGMMLADIMGAEVIRIDRPGGEEDRTIGLISPNGKNISYYSYGRNKRGITLKLIDKNDEKSR